MAMVVPGDPQVRVRYRPSSPLIRSAPVASTRRQQYCRPGPGRIPPSPPPVRQSRSPRPVFLRGWQVRRCRPGGRTFQVAVPKPRRASEKMAASGNALRAGRERQRSSLAFGCVGVNIDCPYSGISPGDSTASLNGNSSMTCTRSCSPTAPSQAVQRFDQLGERCAGWWQWVPDRRWSEFPRRVSSSRAQLAQTDRHRVFKPGDPRPAKTADGNRRGRAHHARGAFPDSRIGVHYRRPRGCARVPGVV